MNDARVSKRLAMLDKAIAAGSNDPFVFYARALELRGLDEPESALAALAEVEQRFPDYVPTYLMAGQVAQTLERVAEARGYLQRGLALATRVRDEHARSELQQALDGLDGGLDGRLDGG